MQDVNCPVFPFSFVALLNHIDSTDLYVLCMSWLNILSFNSGQELCFIIYLYFWWDLISVSLVNNLMGVRTTVLWEMQRIHFLIFILIRTAFLCSQSKTVFLKMWCSCELNYVHYKTDLVIETFYNRIVLYFFIYPEDVC